MAFNVERVTPCGIIFLIIVSLISVAPIGSLPVSIKSKVAPSAYISASGVKVVRPAYCSIGE